MSNIKFKGLTKGIFWGAFHLHKNSEFGLADVLVWTVLESLAWLISWTTLDFYGRNITKQRLD